MFSYTQISKSLGEAPSIKSYLESSETGQEPHHKVSISTVKARS